MKPIPPDHDDRNTKCWHDECPECSILLCSDEAWPCYHCVKAWRHKSCAADHAKFSGHPGGIKDLVYLTRRVR